MKNNYAQKKEIAAAIANAIRGAGKPLDEIDILSAVVDDDWDFIGLTLTELRDAIDWFAYVPHPSGFRFVPEDLPRGAQTSIRTIRVVDVNPLDRLDPMLAHYYPNGWIAGD